MEMSKRISFCHEQKRGMCAEEKMDDDGDGAKKGTTNEGEGET